MTSKYNNNTDRGAGCGVIRAGALPDRRGVWDLYDLQPYYIGMFDRAFWIEYADDIWFADEHRAAALDELATFFDDNIKDNLIMMEHIHKTIMGGIFGMKVGEEYRKRINRKKPGKFERTGLLAGYELRFSERDAVTFKTLWKGYSVNKD